MYTAVLKKLYGFAAAYKTDPTNKSVFLLFFLLYFKLSLLRIYKVKLGVEYMKSAIGILGKL